MELQEFTKNAIKTESLVDSVNVSQNFLYRTLRAYISAATLLDMIKKNVFYGKKIEHLEVQSRVAGLMLAADKLADPDIMENPKTTEIDPRIFHSIIGICTESGELAEELIKHVYLHDGETVEFDTVNFGEELGDIDWYKAIGTDAAGLDPTVILEAVINKLRLRYPGNFSSAAAINRDLDAERSSLEDDIGEGVNAGSGAV